jgi:hypothetical protein
MERRHLDRESRSVEKCPFNDDDEDEVDEDNTKLLPEDRTNPEARYARN